MKTVRIYQNTKLTLGNLLLDESASHHLNKVLRFPQGRNITLFNGDGMNYSARVVLSKKRSEVVIHSIQQNNNESKLNITLVQSIAKGEKMDFLIQKAVELGVTKIVPVFTEHCVIKLKDDKLKKRHTHWQKIIIGAAEQSGRSVVPTLELPTSLEDYIDAGLNNAFVLHHRTDATLLSLKTVNNACLIVGPEGGLSTTEIQHAIDAGATPLCLGKRVLRTETASLVAIANMQLLWGN